LTGIALIVAIASLAGCTERSTAQTKAPAAPPPVPVGAAVVEQKPMPVQVTAVGNVQAYTTVSVKSQVAGQIQKVHFTEGQDVKQGQLLFTIDPRPLEAAVKQAEANVARDRAQLRQMEAARVQREAEVLQQQANLERDLANLENARVQEERYRRLVQEGLIAREQYDQMKTNWATTQATVAATRAAVENAKASAQAADAMIENSRAAIQANEAVVETAKLQFAHTTIKSPMDGRTGNLLVQSGNVLKGNDDQPLVVITQVRPIYVSFAVPEAHLAAIKKFRASGPLKAAVQVDGGREVSGTVTFMNNTVDATTGTIQLKATFPNADNTLWPGQFVDVAMTLTTESAVVVPAQAVQTGQKGAFVFVVKADNTVESRPVKVLRRVARELVIESGVKPGERVVTDGQLRLVPGARVDVRPAKPS
jgi:multidrug efflux system membrane fusion protein